jgi:hypothetical protein
MKLETSLMRMVGLRIGFLIFFPLIVNLQLQVILKQLGESLPGV